jgi:hypothetical protein
MTKSEQKVVAACADTLFPPGGPIPVSGTDAGIVAYVDAHFADLRWTKRTLLRLALLFLQLHTLLFGWRFTRFTRLPPAERAKVLAEMEMSELQIRQGAYMSVRFILTMAYGANPTVTSHIRRGRRAKEAS